VSLRLVLVDHGEGRRRRRRPRAYHRAVVDEARGHALIGRSAELDRLAQARSRAVAGESRVVIVAGEAGIGKSRLVEAFVAGVASDGGRVLSGGCLALGTGGLPYAPFVEAFRALLRDVDPGALPALLGPSRGELARLMPEIRARPDRTDRDPAPDDPTRGGSDERFAQVRLFELVLGVLERLARVAPLTLLVEDLQWADASTQDLLAFLVRNLRDDRILLIATVRTDELEPRHAFQAYFAELERGDRVERLDLSRLGRDDLGRLLADELGQTPDEDLLDRTFERTGGNPFYAEQVLAVARESDDGQLPARLRDVVLARVGAVSEAGQEVLRVASAAGTRIDDELVVAVAGSPALVVRAALREVVERRILVPAGGRSDPHYVFSHALLQEVIHGELFPGERARLHAAYASALTARLDDRTAGRRVVGPPPSAAELAFHWDAAGDEGRALLATMEAARAAEQAYAFLEAHRHYLRALELSARVTGMEDGPAAVDEVEILARAAETAVMIGEYRAAVEFGRRALAGVDATVEPVRAGGLNERQRWYLWEAGDRVAAEAAVAEAERLTPVDPPSPARARILAHHAGILMMNGRFAESIPIAEQAVAVARTVESSSDEALALGILGWDLALLGRVDEGLERVRAGLAIADVLGGAEGIALGATNLAMLLDRVGRTDEALNVAAAGYERARALGVERTYGGLLLALSAKAAIALGRWDEADVSLALGLARQPEGAPGIRLRIQRGRLATLRGDLASAAEVLALARAACEAAGDAEDRAALLAALAELSATGGHITDTRAAVVEGLRMASAGPPDPALASLAATGLRVEADAAALARARHDEAGLADARHRMRQIAAEVERVAGSLGVAAAGADGASEPTRQAIVTALCRAEADRVDDRDGPGQWTAVADGFEAIGRPYPAAYGRYRAAAAVLRERGSRAAARTLLEAARTTAVRLGARPLLAEIDLLARQGRLDLRPDGDSRAGGATASAGGDFSLTDREREVLGLIAAGWSNQEIADALFISRKTASVHASNIFDKLGAANRAEAAAIAHRSGLAADAPSPPRAGA
jgi:DNA-binding CsgD family transcriptional regulator/tetratricopeptide (TPR) repeat protein